MIIGPSRTPARTLSGPPAGRRVRVALVTCRQLPELTPDDRLLLEPLRQVGIEARAIVWDAPGVKWAALDVAVIRSTWDYHTRPARFLRWIERCEADGARLWNPPRVLRWNVHKRYLHDLEGRGVAIVPTAWLERGSDTTLGSVLDERGWERAVIKPAISAGARRTSLVARAEAERAQPAFRALLARQDVLVQPFLEQIADEGEWSFIFLGGEFSHAVLKRPGPGDFRVQERFGGRIAPARPPAGLVDSAMEILETAGMDLLYARVDAARDRDRLLLVELEVLEPSLFFEHDPGAAPRLAAEIARRVGS
jgi:hypothetical protein